MNARYGIAEWYGKPFSGLSRDQRRRLGEIALERSRRAPPCPFQRNTPPCRKRGGVCSLQRYLPAGGGRLGPPTGETAIVCPERFEDGQLLVFWLAEIAGFAHDETMIAREVAFMHGTGTDKPAGKIDMVVARTSGGTLEWYGLEIQAVYFSGIGMASEFENLRDDEGERPPFPNAIRRPDWRSSSAKRLMPQLQVKVPTLRRWGAKMAVAVDKPFFDAVGGISPGYSRDLGDGDVIWLVPQLVRGNDGSRRLARGHWEVLTLETAVDKLLAAETVRRGKFEQDLRMKLEPLVSPASNAPDPPRNNTDGAERVERD